MRFLFLALPLFALAACSAPAPVYAIEAASEGTVVDGAAGEWPAALRPVPDESGLSLGLRRDGGDLMVAVIAGDDRQARRIALGGLAVWVDPAGGTERVLGVRYPTPEAPDIEAIMRSGPRRGGPSTADPQQLRRRFEAGLDAVEVTSGVVTQRATPDGGYAGIEAAATWGARGLVVEFRIPMDATPALRDAPPSDVLGLGIELLDASRTSFQRTMRESRAEAPRGASDRPAIDPANVSVETVTRWLRAEAE